MLELVNCAQQNIGRYAQTGNLASSASYQRKTMAEKIYVKEQDIHKGTSVEDALTRYYQDENADASEVLSASELEAYKATKALKEISRSVPHLFINRLLRSLRSALVSSSNSNAKDIA